MIDLGVFGCCIMIWVLVFYYFNNYDLSQRVFKLNFEVLFKEVSYYFLMYFGEIYIELGYVLI